MIRLGVAAALAALLVAGCGGSSRPKGPPAMVFVSVKDGDYAIFGASAEGKDAYRLTKEKGDLMPSYFLAETLKYLYLLFAPEETLDFASVVFNTEAHPFRRAPRAPRP